MSGSTNALLHLPAIAHELGLEIDADWFDRINREIPYLVNVQPSGEHVSEMVWYAGGVPRVQQELKDMLDLDVMTVTGKTLGENLEQLRTDGFFQRGEGYLANYRIEREDVIYPVAKKPAFRVDRRIKRQPGTRRRGGEIFGGSGRYVAARRTGPGF